MVLEIFEFVEGIFLFLSFGVALSLPLSLSLFLSLSRSLLFFSFSVLPPALLNRNQSKRIEFVCFFDRLSAQEGGEEKKWFGCRFLLSLTPLSLLSYLVKRQLVLDGLDGVSRSPDAVCGGDLDDLELVLEEVALLLLRREAEVGANKDGVKEKKRKSARGALLLLQKTPLYLPSRAIAQHRSQ